jgi:FtsH-binding integral membrane protein
MSTPSRFDPYARHGVVAAEAGASERTGFIRRTYAHLLGAIVAFVALEAVLVQLPISAAIVPRMVGGYGWLVVLAAFMGVSWIADRWARSDTSAGMQYLGLGLFVVAEAILFLPLLYIAANFAGASVLPSAALLTLGTFAALTGVVFTWKQDFSFLRAFLAWGGIIAMILIVASIVFGFNLGVLFSVVMIGFASAAVLYNTSNVLHHYRTDQHVAAALTLFAAVALLFWYVLRLVMSLQRN